MLNGAAHCVAHGVAHGDASVDLYVYDRGEVCRGYVLVSLIWVMVSLLLSRQSCRVHAGRDLGVRAHHASHSHDAGACACPEFRRLHRP